MDITVYKKNNVELEMVFNRQSIFFFRLRVPNISFNYRNPLTGARLAMEKLAVHELDEPWRK